MAPTQARLFSTFRAVEGGMFLKKKNEKKDFL